jgi:universal stress protein A
MDPWIRKIVVPIDFSPSSERAANYAAAFARRVGASLHLIHALERPAPMRGASEAYEVRSAEHLDDLYWAARTRLGTLSEKLGLEGRISREVRPGLAFKVITAAVVDLGADLVIMSTHGRTGLSHLLMGSVAERVIRSSACSVLILRDSGTGSVHQQVAAEDELEALSVCTR